MAGREKKIGLGAGGIAAVGAAADQARKNANVNSPISVEGVPLVLIIVVVLVLWGGALTGLDD
ncbi:hypothetical protein ACFR95_05350 [Halolamina salifodinae]|uniref:hypothetical protein n=1 Tax=Halolamina salifodinae TaxID=1202767 RepID=UPI003637310E